MDLHHLGERLKAERLKRGWTHRRVVEELGYRPGVTVTTISVCEHMDAMHYPSLLRVAQLAELYGLELTFREKTDE